MTQMMEQWMPAFMEFSKVMSETSVELAKSRLQNDELSRMLKETRSQLDAVLAERAGSSSSPVKKPESSSPSLEDWKALKDSLNEVTASLKDFRRWLPTAMPPPQVTLPLPPLNYPPPVLPMNTSADSGILNVLENQKNQQMVLSHLLQQQERQLRAGFGTQSPPQGKFDLKWVFRSVRMLVFLVVIRSHETVFSTSTMVADMVDPSHPCGMSVQQLSHWCTLM